MMSPQMTYLKNLMDTAKAGSTSSIPVLRLIVKAAADAASGPDLIAMAEHLFHLGQQAAETEQGRN